MSRSRISASFLLDHLSRVTTAGRKFVPQIDGLRFLAIISVVAYHVSNVVAFHRGYTNSSEPPTGWLYTLFRSGHNGVPLFFAISGFILSLPFARHALNGGPAINLRDYYIRRVTRIEPPYVIQLVVMMALCAFVYRRLPSHPHLYHNPDWLAFAGSHIAASLFYLNGWIFGEHPYPNYVLWSLEVEVQFYMIAPFLARVFLVRKQARRFGCMAALFFLGLVVDCFFGHQYRIWASLAGNIQYFVIGFFFADLYAQGRLLLTRGEYKWDFALVAAVGAVVWGEPSLTLFTLPLAVVLCFVAAFRGVFSVVFLRNPWIVTIGGMCYTIYLYHVFFLSVFIRLSEKIRLANADWDLLLQFILVTVPILCVCAVLFAFLERPFMDRNWPAKFYRAVLRRPLKNSASPAGNEARVV
jgi:peptidoglycan/LPS O-acetylase OafA/YrhL